MSARQFWNEELETMPLPARQRLEGERLQKQLVRIAAVNDYYREKWQTAVSDISQIRHQNDLAQLPFTEKSELAAAQRSGVLLGGNQSAPLHDIVRIVGTGGTSGQPLRLALTRRDIKTYSEQGARALWAMGCRPADFVINCFNYSLYAGGVLDHSSFEKLGAAILPYSVGQSNRLLAMMDSIQHEMCLYSTPSYAIKLAERAAELGIATRNLGVRKGFFSGEAGMQVPGYRERIEDLWGMKTADLYGAAEVGAQSAECEYRTGLHFFGQGLVIAELIDPETTAVLPMTHGATGELVFTTLLYEACPLIRLRTHDFVEIYTDPCPCGRTGFRFHVLGRSDDMFIVKGLNVFPASIQKVLLSLQPSVTGEFYIILDKAPPIDYPPIIHVEVANNIPEAQQNNVARKVEATIREQLGYRTQIKLVRQGTIASEHKTRRLYRTYQGQTPPTPY